MRPKAITIAIVALGGEGGGVLADWLVDLAEHHGYYAQSTSVPGVAQRTGSTIYYLELFPETAVAAAAQPPVLALMPVPGEVDIVVASELMEAARAVERGLVTVNRTTLVASSHRVYSMTERTALGDGRVDSAVMMDACRGAAKTWVSADFAEIARQTQSVISAVLLGALAATSALPFSREQFGEAIRRGGVGVEPSLRAFEGGWQAASQHTAAAPPLPATTAHPLALRIAREFPPAAHDILFLAVDRLTGYQDERYAAQYLDRLQPIVDRTPGSPLLRETARYLALWMAYEDAIRVACVKVRRERFDRVRREAGAKPEQLLRIHEYLHPRLGELADIAPVWLGRRLLSGGLVARLVNRFTREGKVVETTSLRGFLQLYLLARLRPLRRRSLRFEREQRQIDRWLALVRDVAQDDDALAREVAECPRLLKGYGDTHARGTRNFETLMAALPQLRSAPGAARRLKALREAALADESGQKLAQALQQVAT